MFSKRWYKVLSLILNITRKLRSYSLEFNPKTKTPKITVNLEIVSHIQFNFSLLVFWTVSALAMVLKHRLNDDLNNFHLTLCWWGGLLLVLVLYSYCVFFYQETSSLVNGFILWLIRIRSEFMPKFNPERNVVNKLLYIALVITLIGISALAISSNLYLLMYPRHVIFLGALIPEKYSNILTLFPVYIFHSYLLLVVCSALATTACFIISYSFYVAYLFKFQIRLGRKTYISDSVMRKGHNIRFIYRSMQVIHESSLRGSCLGHYLVVMNALFVLEMTYISFVPLGYWKGLSPMTKAPMMAGDMLGMGVWTFILQMGSLLDVEGYKTLLSWRRNNWGFSEQNKLMRKFCRSCKPILFCYGKQFVVGMVCVLNFYRCVSRGTFRALLTIK